MENEKRLIDANALRRKMRNTDRYFYIKYDIDEAPTVDAVEVDAVRAWLYEIAMNNVNNPVCDACEEIISRLDGLRLFAKERKDYG